ncbi:MAG: polysaccharide lyase family 7 protein [Pseudomonas sp.]
MLDLAIWNLTLPVGSPATVIETSVLAQGYQDPYFESSSGVIFFWAPVTGSTTENASYPRSELRETFADGQLRNWTYPSADNFLRASLTVDQVPSTGKVVIGQIHAYQSSYPMLKLEYQYSSTTKTGKIVAKVRGTPGDSPIQVITVAQGVALSQRFTYSIHLTPGGTLSVNANSYNWSSKLDPAWAPKPLYFKAGMYVQDNSGLETEGGKANFYKLEVEHRPLL